MEVLRYFRRGLSQDFFSHMLRIPPETLMEVCLLEMFCFNHAKLNIICFLDYSK